ncbi:MAG: glycosyltransferase [Candidatus Omnitrophota bacterium]|jgi:glycosyltransferase involved in cell wall biosynthesis
MQKFPNPKVSVCIPVYNCRKYIGLAIKSVLSQTFQDFELIIIDNNSTDGTAEEIARFKDSRINFVHNEVNLGAQNNWNKALRLAKGELIKLLPADDIIYPECLKKQIEVLDDPCNSDVVLVCCARDVINAKGSKIFFRSSGMKKGKVLGQEIVARNITAGTNILGEPGAVLFRKNIISKVGEFNGEYPFVIDLDLWVRMLLYGYAYVSPEAYCAVRISNQSWGFSLGGTQADDFCKLVDKLYADKRYNLTETDCLRGKLMAKLNRMLRKLFYLFNTITLFFQQDA